MLFPFLPPKHATFHMGTVGYPIDIVFFDANGRAARIVTAAPGSRARWDLPGCSAVVETPGGFCRRAGFHLGGFARVADDLSYGVPELRQRELTDDPSNVDPSDRYRDRQDVSLSSPDAMDGAAPGWEQDFGYSQLNPEYREHEGPALRPAARRIAQTEILDPSGFVAGLVEGIARDAQVGGGIPWRPERLTAGVVESAVITYGDLDRWLDRLKVAGKDAVLAAAATPNGLQLLGDGLVLAGIADLARVKGDALAVWRGGENRG